VLVEESRFNYWRPGDPILGGHRFLVGLAAFFNLRDLRLADILNDTLKTRVNDGDLQVDVFDVATDCADFSSDMTAYYPGFPDGYFDTPIVGEWLDGQHVKTLTGHPARQFILDAVGAGISADEAVTNLSPPDKAFFE